MLLLSLLVLEYFEVFGEYALQDARLVWCKSLVLVCVERDFHAIEGLLSLALLVQFLIQHIGELLTHLEVKVFLVCFLRLF